MDYTSNIKEKKVLVTGGLGFVGNSLVAELVNKYGCKVIVVDDCSNSSPAILGDLINKIEFHKISVLESDKLFPLFADVNFIFHLACVQISASGSMPVHDMRVNAESTLNALEYLRKNKPPRFERFIYTSSCSVYGSFKNLPATEDGITKVLSNYAATKLLGENYTIIYHKQYGISTSSVRYSNVYGIGQSPTNPYCGVLGKFVHNALTGQPLTVIGDGEQTRDYTYIQDAVSATILAAVHPKALGEVFNVGTSIETSVNKLVDLIKEKIPAAQVVNVPERDIDNIRRRSVDIEKINSYLNWAPVYNLKRGIEITLDWYRDFLKKK
ncbi:MAG: NAD-dependent epimerase/dehydratase family protein [Bacteroidia bacterium]|nr:NAD-dependent epimerase/dehydratase family protein [Bacteroidia bacterium]